MDAIEPRQLAPGLFVLELPAANAYLWQWSDSLTLIDTGTPGSAVAILQAIESIGCRPDDLDEILLTHFHLDHTGSAAELAERTGATVMAHRADVAVIGGLQSPPAPDLTELERPLAAMLFGDPGTLPGPQPAPVRVDREVDDGDLTGGGGTILGLPGHTPGSIGLLVPQLGVLFTGDTIASYEGAPVLGPFNIDRPAAIDAVRKQARLDFDIACFGHGKPIVGGASRKVLALIRSF